MKLEKILLKNILILNLIVVFLTFLISLGLRINLLIKDENKNIYLTSKMFEKYLNDVLSKTNSYKEYILSKNDIIFIFDKNPLIRKFSLNALEEELNKIIKDNSFIKSITIKNNNDIVLKVGSNENIDMQNSFSLSNDCFCINIINNISDNKFLTFTLNLNNIFSDFINSISSSVGLLLKYNNNFYSLKPNTIDLIENTNKYFISKPLIFDNTNLYIFRNKSIIYNAILNYLFFFLIIFSISFIIVFFISKKIANKITTPINNITDTISDYKNFKNFIPIDINKFSEYEVITLAEKFNKMGLELKNYIQNMEDLVLKRTQKIEEQNLNLELLNKKLRKISITDELTSLYNRHFFNEMFIKAYKLAYREKLYINFAILDIDHFKNINDTYGHLAGDYCLKELGKITKNHFNRENDMIFRYGGEEFVIYYLSKESTNFDKSLESLRIDIQNNLFNYDGFDIKFTVSIGAISKIPDTNKYEKFIMLADKNLYKSKNSGRNKLKISY
jgi:diguanylate cyclase (GGDEF)-like protein